MIGEIQEHCQIESSNPDFTDENREKVQMYMDLLKMTMEN